MSRSRLAVITLACLLPFSLALASFDYKVWHIVITEDGDHVVTGSEEVDDPYVTGEFAYGCQGWTFSNCGWCQYCHTGGEDRQREVFTGANHLQGYYPRFKLSLSDGQKLSWGQSGGYLTSQRGQLKYYLRDGTLDLIAPPGSLILKDRTGRPFLLFMRGRPELQPKSR